MGYLHLLILKRQHPYFRKKSFEDLLPGTQIPVVWQLKKNTQRGFRDGSAITCGVTLETSYNSFLDPLPSHTCLSKFHKASDFKSWKWILNNHLAPFPHFSHKEPSPGYLSLSTITGQIIGKAGKLNPGLLTPSLVSCFTMTLLRLS